MRKASEVIKESGEVAFEEGFSYQDLKGSYMI